MENRTATQFTTERTKRQQEVKPQWDAIAEGAEEGRIPAGEAMQMLGSLVHYIDWGWPRNECRCQR